MTRREHIEHLARELGARVHHDAERFHGFAHVPTRQIHVTPWTGFDDLDTETYWVALHELGHVATTPVDPFILMFGGSDVTRYEADAWNWALERSLEPLGRIARSSIAWGIASYVHGMGIPSGSDSLARLVRAVGFDIDWDWGDDGNKDRAVPAWTRAWEWAQSRSALAAAA